MSEPTPNSPVPPKPAEASRIQPKKETVRISLPPKPAAPQVKMPDSNKSINLIVPQVGEIDTTVKIPNAAEIMTSVVGAKPVPAAPPSAPPPSSAAPAPALAHKVGEPVAVTPASKIDAKKPNPKPVPMQGVGPVRASKVDMALAIVAAIVAIVGAVKVFLLPGISL